MKKVILSGLLLLIGMIVFAPQQGHALSPFPNATNGYSGGDNCKGTDGGNFNLVIYVKIVNNDNSLVGYSSHFSFKVNSYAKPGVTDETGGNKGYLTTYKNKKANSILYRNTSTNPPASIAQSIAQGNNQDATETPKVDYYVNMVNKLGNNSKEIFEAGKGNACIPGTGDGQSSNEFQPAYAFRDGDNTRLTCFPAAASGEYLKYGCGTDPVAQRSDLYNNQSHLLSCLSSQATAYRVSSPGVSDIVNGVNVGTLNGEWSVKVNGTSRDLDYSTGKRSIKLEPADNEEINGKSATVVFTYKLPPQNPPPQTSQAIFTPAAGINGAVNDEIEAASSATATASITNSGNGAGSVNWVRRFWYDNGDERFYGNGNGDYQIAAIENGFTSLPAGVTQNHDSAAPWSLGGVDGSYAKLCTALHLTSGYTGNDTNSTAGGIPSQAGVCYKIVRKPFFGVYVGDVNAAMGYCDEAVNTNSVIKGFAKSSDGISYIGAGTTVAAFARGQIDQFISARNGFGTSKPKYLTFANKGSFVADSTYGGNGGNAVVGCMNKESIPDNAPDSLTVGITEVNNVGAQHTWYAKGDIYITATNTSSKYANFSLGNVPSLKFVAGGNIYIDQNVTNLSGVLKAEKGTIYTCAVQGNLPTDNSPIPDPTACNTQTQTGPSNQLTGLIVRGALIARDIKLTRTYGTLSHTGPAESIYFSPEVWIQSLPGTTSTSGSGSPYGLSTQYDSIISLPPVL